MQYKLLAASIVLAASSTANAEILEYSFIDTNNANVFRPSNSEFINPKNGFKLTLSAGLDRVLRVKVYKGATVVNTQTTGMVGINDRIQTSDGKDYYGKVVTLPKLADGQYRIVQDTLDGSQNVVKTEEVTVGVDTLPPVILGQLEVRNIQTQFTSSIDIFSNRGGPKDVFLSGIEAEGASVDKVVYFTSKDGVKRTAPARYNSVEKSASILAIDAASYQLAPEQAIYNVGFEIYDQAGNKVTVSHNSGIDRVEPKIIAQIFNYRLEQWEDYVAGMMVYRQPIKIRWRRNKSDHTEFNNSRFGWIPGQYNNQDADYVYYESSYYYPQVHRYIRFYTLAGIYRDMHLHKYDLTLANGLEEGPKPITAKCKTDYDPEWSDCERIDRGTPYELTHIRIYAEKRSYEQRAGYESFEKTCQIMPGEDYCDIRSNIVINDGVGFRDIYTRVGFSQDNASQANTGRLIRLTWDFDPPQIHSTTLKDKSLEMMVIDNSATNAWNAAFWGISDLQAIARSGSTVVNLPTLNVEKLDYKSHKAVFDTSVLPDGEFELEVSVIDYHGNKTVKSLGSKTYDSTAPTIKVLASDKDVVNGQTVYGLESIKVVVNDLHQGEIQSINLTGGPLNDSVFLDWVNTAPNTYKLEYPRIFPSLEANQDYSLIVNAKDSYGNVSTKTHTLKYVPNNLFQLEGVNVFAVNQLVLDSKGKPLTVITSNQLRADSGNLASGNQEILFTLRVDAPFGLVANGVAIKPGETKTVNYNIDNTDGKIHLPIYPSESGIEGKASFLMEIPRIN